MSKRPFATLDFELLWTGEFKQVANGGRKNEMLALKVIVMLGETAQCLGDVAGDRGFFGDDQLFGHGSCL